MNHYTDAVMARLGDFNFADFNFNPQGNAPYNDAIHSLPQPIHSAPYPASSSTGSPRSGLISPPQGPVGDKRKASEAGTEDEVSRVAAEEDKRRRNTAASARFRVKKKQREQALERSAKEMSDKVAALEGRINQLETENKWLKNLITEKNENKDDIATLWKKYNTESSERKGSERKDGVGTEDA